MSWGRENVMHLKMKEDDPAQAFILTPLFTYMCFVLSVIRKILLLLITNVKINGSIFFWFLRKKYIF